MVILLDVLYPTYPTSGLGYASDILVFFFMLAANFLVNLALAAILLKLAPKFSFKKKGRELILLVAGLTVLAFFLEIAFSAFSFANYVFSLFMLAGIYYWLFKRLGLKWKRALACGLAFGILTNPLVGDMIIYLLRWP